MARNDQHDDLLDLGTASVETLGGLNAGNDDAQGQQGLGLSDD